MGIVSREPGRHQGPKGHTWDFVSTYAFAAFSKAWRSRATGHRIFFDGRNVALGAGSGKCRRSARGAGSRTIRGEANSIVEVKAGFARVGQRFSVSLEPAR